MWIRIIYSNSQNRHQCAKYIYLFHKNSKRDKRVYFLTFFLPRWLWFLCFFFLSGFSSSTFASSSAASSSRRFSPLQKQRKKLVYTSILLNINQRIYLFKLTMPLGFLANTLLHSFSLPLIVNCERSSSCSFFNSSICCSFSFYRRNDLLSSTCVNIGF